MKKFLTLIALISFIAPTNGCQSTTPANSSNPSTNPSSSSSVNPSPASGNGDPYFSRASFLTFINCVKTKQPGLAPSLDDIINQVNKISDSQWTPDASAYFKPGTQGFLNSGCN